MRAVSGCWILDSGCHHTAKAITGEEMRNDWYNDSLLSRSGTGTSQGYMLEVVAGFPSTVVLINLQGVDAETEGRL